MDDEKNRIALRRARFKIAAIGLAIGVVFVLSLGFLVNQYMNKSEEQRLGYLKQAVELARNTIEPILVNYRSQKISRVQALDRIRDLVRRMVYRDNAGKNYIFMSSYDGTMLVQPFEPQREMTNMWDLKDSYGVFIIRSLVETAKSGPGSGYVSYHYKRPGQTKPEEKISFVIGIPELDCYIGTGKYMTDIRDAQQFYVLSIAALTFILLVLLSILVFFSMKEFQRQNLMLQQENSAIKAVEETLRRSEAKFRQLFDDSAVPLCLIDIQGKILDFNTKFREVFGYEYHDIPTLEEWWMLAYPDDEYRQLAVNTWKNAQKYNIDIHTVEHQVTCKGGEVRNVIISSKTFQGYFLSTYVDITERKQAEDALKSSEEKYRLLVDNAEEAIFVAQDGFLKYVNPKTETITGYSAEDLLKNPFIDFILPDDRPLVSHRHDQRTQGLDLPPNYEFRVVQKNGNTKWIDLKVVLIEWEGRPATLNFSNDVTSRKLAEEEKEKLESQLRQSQKMEAIGILAGGVAHDFNNLLQAINGFTELMIMAKTENDPDWSKLLGIQNAAHRAAHLVKQLLLFSRKAGTERKLVDMNQEIQHVKMILERTIPKMIEIQLHHDHPLWAVNADPVQIEQILLNLGVNASDAMPDGGSLIIETRNIQIDEEFPQDNIDATHGNYVLLTVSDTGQGMDRETVEHIFEPFFTTKEIGKGTGLGLASVYGIIKSHDGYISCYSQPGQGTVFKIYLPAFDQGQADSEKRLEVKPPRGGTETILLVDDEELIRHFASQVLGQFGYTVLTSPNGEEALEIYSQRPNEIDLVILDLGMPGMGGHRCLQDMMRLHPDAKVIIASGYSINGQLSRIMEAGAAGFVGKPYQAGDLLEKVRIVLDEENEKQPESF